MFNFEDTRKIIGIKLIENKEANIAIQIPSKPRSFAKEIEIP